MNGWRVRDAGPEDAAACAAVYAPYVTGTVVSFETVPPSAEEMAARIADHGTSHAWLVLEQAGVLAGYAYAHRFSARAAYDWSCETTIYLDPARTGAGGGWVVYTALLERLAERGFRRAFAGMTLPNPASEALHRALGFVPVGVYRQVGWKNGAWHDVAWVQRSLGEDGAPPASLR